MQKKTFTLIEMLIVVVIIGILAAALIPRLQSVQARARDTKRKADLHQIATAMEIYKEDNGWFAELMWDSTAIPDWGWCDDIWPIIDPGHSAMYYPGTPNITEFLAILMKYMTSIPTDPTLSSPRRPVSWCSWGPQSEDGVYWYVFAWLPRRGHTVFNSFILAARTESDGSSSNRVANNEVIKTLSFAITGDATYPWVWTIAWWMAWSSRTRSNNQRVYTAYGPFNAQVYDDYICTKVTFDSGTTNDWQWTCTADKNGNDLRYIYVQ